jgi:hypothetical protein
MLKVGVTFNLSLNDTSAFGRAIATLRTFRCFAIQLHELGIVNVGTERAFNCLQIRPYGRP